LNPSADFNACGRSNSGADGALGVIPYTETGEAARKFGDEEDLQPSKTARKTA